MGFGNQRGNDPILIRKPEILMRPLSILIISITLGLATPSSFAILVYEKPRIPSSDPDIELLALTDERKREVLDEAIPILFEILKEKVGQGNADASFELDMEVSKESGKEQKISKRVANGGAQVKLRRMQVRIVHNPRISGHELADLSVAIHSGLAKFNLKREDISFRPLKASGVGKRAIGYWETALIYVLLPFSLLGNLLYFRKKRPV